MDLNYTQKLAKFVRDTSFDSLPTEVVHQAKRCVLDSLGCSLGGSETNLGKIATKTIRSLGGERESTVFGEDFKTSCVNAAFLNTTTANAMDFDDTLHGHPGNTVIPPALAVGEKLCASGEEVIAATVLGYEVSMRIARAIQPSAERWRNVWGIGTWQTFGAVTAAGKLLDLDEVEMANAFLIAGTSAPVPSSRKALRDCQSMVKGTCGHASMQGVFAALLSKNGFSSTSQAVFEGDRGFWVMAGSDRCKYEELISGLDKEYQILDVAFKQYPSCRWMHSSMDAALKIVQKNKIDPSEIERILIKTYSQAVEYPFSNQEPNSIIEAEFSLPYSLASAILRKPSPDWFSDEGLKEAKVLRLSKKVELKLDEKAQKAFLESGHTELISNVEIETNDKRKYFGGADMPKGERGKPMTDEELENKFRSLSKRVLGKQKTEAILTMTDKLEKMGDIHALVEVLRKE